jgi:hypothetical protein
MKCRCTQYRVSNISRSYPHRQPFHRLFIIFADADSASPMYNAIVPGVLRGNRELFGRNSPYR